MVSNHSELFITAHLSRIAATSAQKRDCSIAITILHGTNARLGVSAELSDRSFFVRRTRSDCPFAFRTLYIFQNKMRSLEGISHLWKDLFYFVIRGELDDTKFYFTF